MNISCWAKSRKNGWTIALVLLTFAFTFVLWTTTIMAQEQELMLSILRIDSQDYPNLSAYVTVIDKSGMPQADLQADGFEMSEDRNAISLSEMVSDTSDSLWLVLALDTSMNKEEFAEIQKHLNAFIKTMTAQDQIEIFTFADESGKEAQAFTTDKRLLSNFVDSLSITYKETKATYTAASMAIMLAAQQERAGPLAVILITDSGNVGDAEGHIEPEMLEQIKEEKIPLYVVGFGPNIKTDDLQSLTEQIIGQSYLLEDSDLVEATLNSLRAELRKGYRLTWKSELSTDDSRHELVVNLASQPDAPPVTKSFYIENAIPLPVDVEVKAVTEAEVVAKTISNQFSVGERVRLQAKVERGEVKQVKFSLDNEELKLDSIEFPVTVKEEPYQIEFVIPDHPSESYEIIAEVEDVRGKIGTRSIEIQIKAAPVTWRQWFWQTLWPILWPSLQLLLLLLLTLWLLAYLLAWQQRNLRQKFALKITNEGNMPSRYELQAKQKGRDKALQFEFFHEEQLLVARQLPEPEPDTEPAPSSASQNAPPEERNGASTTSATEQTATPTASEIVDKAQGMAILVSNIAALLGPFGGPIRNLLNTATQSIMSVRSIVQIPEQSLRRLGVSLPKASSDSSTVSGRTTPSSQTNQPLNRTARRVQPRPPSSPPTLGGTRGGGVETPDVGHQKTLWIDLFVSPPWRFLMGGNYAFTITAHLMDQQISQFKSIEGQLHVGQMRWLRIWPLLFVFITLGISITLAYFIIREAMIGLL